MRRSLPSLLALCAASLLIAAPSQAQERIPVRTVQPTQQPLTEQRVLSGSLVALRRAQLSSRESGVVAELLVDVGDQVSAGQALLRLDATLVKLQAARAEAALAEARTRQEEARRVSEESAQLADQKNIARTQARAAEAEARIQLAAVASARADLALASERVQRHTLKAPFAGVISARQVDLGEWVDPSSPTFDLIDSQALRFDLQAPQELHNRITLGDRAMLSIDALTKQIPAVVSAVVPVKDPTARTFLVRLSPAAEAENLAPGMSGEATLAIGQAAQVWTLPRDAVIRYPDGTHGIWLVEDSSSGPLARARQVKLGVTVADQGEIRGGISGGERVVDRGNERLREGAAVELR